MANAWEFKTQLNSDEMLAALQASLADLVWSFRETEPEGRYILGRAEHGEKVRVLWEATPLELELYDFSDPLKTSAEIFKALQAESIEPIE